MEEKTIVQLITIFLSSHLLEDIKIDIYETDDTLLQRISIHNYDSKTIKIYNNVNTFYCIANNSVYLIQEQFQCDFKQLLKQNERPTIQKRFQSFKLTITVEFSEEFRTSLDLNNPQKTDDLFMSLAIANLKKIQRKILKKMEVQQLKKPIRSNCKISCRNTGVQEINTNICFAGTDKKKLTSQKKFGRRNSKKIQSARQPQILHIQVQNNQNIIENYFDDTKRKVKHKTFAYEIEQMYKEVSLQQIQIKQNDKVQKPMYDLIMQVFNKSLQKANKLTKNHRNRNLLKSYHNLLVLQTQKDLQMQNKILNVINNSKENSKFTPTQSRNKPTVFKSLKVSPYKVSTTFRKRKVH